MQQARAHSANGQEVSRTPGVSGSVRQFSTVRAHGVRRGHIPARVRSHTFVCLGRPSALTGKPEVSPPQEVGNVASRQLRLVEQEQVPRAFEHDELRLWQ